MLWPVILVATWACSGRADKTGREHPRGNLFGRRIKIDAPVKSRHSGEPRIGSGAGTGVQMICNELKNLDSGFHRNDKKGPFSTF